MQAQQVLGDAPRLGDAFRVARDDRDALDALVGLEVGERRQHALELCARRVRGPGARGRAPEHHGEVLDARERERARHVRRREALHVGAIAGEVPESREHDELRHEAAAPDRQHEHFAGGGTDRSPPREVADRAVQHPVDVLGSAGRLDVREGAEDDRGGLALRDAAFHERELDGLCRRVALRCRGRRGGQGDADELVQELALLALGEVAPCDLRLGRSAQVLLPERRHAATARQHLRQRGRRAGAREVRDRAPDVRVARQRAVAFLRVPGRKARPLREGKRHGAVPRGPAAERQLAARTAKAEYGVLAETRDQAEAIVRRRQPLDRVARGVEQAGLGLRPVGPLAGVEGIEVLAQARRGQQLAEPGERHDQLSRQVLGAVLEVEHRHAADERVGAAQRLNRDKSALVGRAELDDARDALAALVRQRRARDEPALAVSHDDDVLAALAQQAVGEFAAVPERVAAPVVGVEHRVEPGDAQHEAQALVGELEDPDRPVAVAGGQGELHELALRDLDRVEPGDVGAAVLAQAPDARAHDAREDQQARAAAHAGRAARQAGKLLFHLEVRGHRAILRCRVALSTYGRSIVRKCDPAP